MTDSSSHGSVFVDPTGRRRTVVRTVGIAGTVVLVGYLVLVLLVTFGAPLPPAARLPVPVELGSGAADQQPPAVPAVAPTTSGDPEPAPSTSKRAPAGKPAATTAGPTTAPPTTSRRSQRPSSPPGQGKQPTAPPGHG